MQTIIEEERREEAKCMCIKEPPLDRRERGVVGVVTRSGKNTQDGEVELESAQRPEPVNRD